MVQIENVMIYYSICIMSYVDKLISSFIVYIYRVLFKHNRLISVSNVWVMCQCGVRAR